MKGEDIPSDERDPGREVAFLPPYPILRLENELCRITTRKVNLRNTFTAMSGIA
jgi:hypothetical protein